jgi:hypothetical protein
MYGSMNKIRTGADFNAFRGNGHLDTIGTRGWFLVSTLDYKMDWGTPGIFAWWASGDSKAGVNGDMMGRMPVMSGDTGFSPSHFGFRGAEPWISSRGWVANTGVGTWGIGLQIANMSFVEDLKHTIKLLYYRGTNDAEIIRDAGGAGHDVARLLSRSGAYPELYLTTKDRVWEINFDHEYKIYENLTALLELGYLHLGLDSDVWGSNRGGQRDQNKTSDHAWKAQLQFRYSF